MKTKFYANNESISREIQKFRKLKSYCEHDLKSAVGIMKGFAQILVDEIGAEMSEYHRDFLIKARNSAEDCLKEIEQQIHLNQPQFETLWWLSPNEPGFELPNRDLLFVHIPRIEEWKSLRDSYRPTYFFIEPNFIKGELEEVLQKTGPFFSKIYFLSKDHFEESFLQRWNIQGQVSPEIPAETLLGLLKNDGQ